MSSVFGLAHLDSLREIYKDIALVDDCVVYKKLHNSTDNDPTALSDGTGGILPTADSGVQGFVLGNTSKCRVTIQGPSAGLGEIDSKGEIIEINTGLIIVPNDLDIDTDDRVLVTFTSKEGEVVLYDILSRSHHSESFGKRFAIQEAVGADQI